MSLTSLLYGLLRLSRDANAVRRGPRATGKRVVRKAAYRGLSRVLARLLR